MAGPTVPEGRPGPSARVLVVTVWFEGPDRTGFRARVSAGSPGGGMANRHVTADPTTIPAVVTAWLHDLLRPAQD
jgi:hypothetical protein